MWNDLPRPAVIAHRGAKTYAPENTLAAFSLAARSGADVIELDAKLSADGTVVVIHDATVDRTTDGTGQVSALSLTSLRALDAGSWFGPQYKNERIPTLDEVFETVGRQLLVNVELTNYSTPDDALVERVAAIVRRHSMQSRVLFSSFHPDNLQRASALLPQVPRALLAAAFWRGWQARRSGWQDDLYQALNPFVLDTSRRLVEIVHARHKSVNVWTVNLEAQMRWLQTIDVDGIIGDDPALLLRVLGRAP